MLDEDIIEPVKTGSKWTSQIVPIPKPDGNLRICCDMRNANEAIIREQFPIPTVEEIMQDMNGAAVFTKLDLKAGFHQLELAEDSREITTFQTHKGLFRYKRLMFGVNCSPEKMQRVIQEVLQGCDGVKNISDDIVVWGVDHEEHDRRLDKVLKRLVEVGLTLNYDKCKFRKLEIVFVGHIISKDGIRPADDKLEAVRKFRAPRDPTEVKSFKGLVQFLSDYLPDLATVAEPLWRVTRKSQKFQFGKEQKEAFQKVKDIVSDAKTLAYFNLKYRTYVVADASPVGLGAVLIQEQDGQQRVISYASYSLSDVERRYSQTEKEALGLVWACERFKTYQLGV